MRLGERERSLRSGPRPTGGDNTGVILGLVPRTHRAASMVAAAGARRAALPGRWPIARGAMGPRAKPEDDGGGDAGKMTLAEWQQAGTVPLSPAPSGERAEAGVLAGRGRGAAACSQANAHLHEQVLGGIRANSRPSP